MPFKYILHISFVPKKMAKYRTFTFNMAVLSLGKGVQAFLVAQIKDPFKDFWCEHISLFRSAAFIALTTSNKQMRDVD